MKGRLGARIHEVAEYFFGCEKKDETRKTEGKILLHDLRHDVLLSASIEFKSELRALSGIQI